jgi:hypothetical protein
MAMIVLSKFDVAERQLLQAITMFFHDEDPVSIHTLAEAAAQVLSDIGEKYGAKSFLRESDKIREDKKKEWLGYLFKSRNFFKHADRDKDGRHEFKTEFNDFSLLDAVHMYTAIKKQWVPETLVFQSWFAVEYPNLIEKGSDFSKMFETARNNNRLPDPKDKQLLYEFIRMMREGRHVVGNVNLECGL